MIDHIWTVLCSRAVIDTETNNVSLQNVIERIDIEAEPKKTNGILAMQLELMSFWGRSEADVPSFGYGRIDLVYPTGAITKSHDYKIDLSEFERTRYRLRIRGLHLKNISGRYVFRVNLRNDGENEWHQVAAVPLTITFTSPETGQSENESIAEQIV